MKAATIDPQTLATGELLFALMRLLPEHDLGNNSCPWPCGPPITVGIKVPAALIDIETASMKEITAIVSRKVAEPISRKIRKITDGRPFSFVRVPHDSSRPSQTTFETGDSMAFVRSTSVYDTNHWVMVVHFDVTIRPSLAL